MEEEPSKVSKEAFNRVSHRYKNSLIYKKSVNACKGKKIGYSRKTPQTKCSTESSSSISSLGTQKPTFYHPKKKVLLPDSSPSIESDTEDDQFEFELKSQESNKLSNNSELSIMVQPSENEHLDGELSTDISLQEYGLKNPNVKSKRKTEHQFKTLQIPFDFSEEEEESDNEIDYTTYPNYLEFKHFETKIDDKQFMEVVTERLSKIQGNISYRAFQKELLPQHRKPNFSDYFRFRKCEKIMLKK